MNESKDDIYKVDFKYYTKPENSQPITNKSMQELYQGLEDRAKETYLRINKAQDYAQNITTNINSADTGKAELRDMYNEHIVEMNSPLVSLLNTQSQSVKELTPATKETLVSDDVESGQENISTLQKLVDSDNKIDNTYQEDVYKVNFQYYTKPENSQPITNKSMQELYQGLEDRAKETYLRINKAQDYAQNLTTALKSNTTGKTELRNMYNEHIAEMNSPLVSLLNTQSQSVKKRVSGT
ncbi:MAG: hypothetical protein WC274_05600 [Sulfurimonas sp.]